MKLWPHRSSGYFTPGIPIYKAIGRVGQLHPICVAIVTRRQGGSLATVVESHLFDGESPGWLWMFQREWLFGSWVGRNLKISLIEKSMMVLNMRFNVMRWDHSPEKDDSDRNKAGCQWTWQTELLNQSLGYPHFLAQWFKSGIRNVEHTVYESTNYLLLCLYWS